MPHVRIKGLNSKSRTLADGCRVTYWWAWKGGPRLPGLPGSPEFLAAYNAAIIDRRAPARETLAALVIRYRASPEWAAMARSTRAQWVRWLDRIQDAAGALAIGDLPLAALDDRRVRAEILAWRDQFAASPRNADYAIQVLSRVLGWSVDRGLLSINAAAGVPQLYSADRADIVWTADDIARFQAAAGSPEVGFIVRLAALTGLRRADLATLTWTDVGALAIVRRTGKSRGRKTAIVPLLPETSQLLAQIRAQANARAAELKLPIGALTVLTNTRGRPWSIDGLEHQVIAAKTRAGLTHLHLHDARGTFALRLRKAGLTGPEIADILGWSESRVERLLSTYIDRDSIVMALAKRIGGTS